MSYVRSSVTVGNCMVSWQPSWLVWPKLKASRLQYQIINCLSCSRRGGGSWGQPRLFSLRHLPGLHLPPLRVPQDAHRDAEAGGTDPGPLHTVHSHLTRQARVSEILHQKYLRKFENILLSDTWASSVKATACWPWWTRPVSWPPSSSSSATTSPGRPSN